MENRQSQFITKILQIFTNTGFGIEKFDEGTYDIIDRSIIGKAKIGSIKVLGGGEISIKLGGEAKKRGKFASLMKKTSFKAKPTNNVATVAAIVKNMLNEYKKAKKEIYKESYEQYKVPAITRDTLEGAIDSYLAQVAVLKESTDIEENYVDLLTFVSDKLSLKLPKPFRFSYSFMNVPPKIPGVSYSYSPLSFKYTPEPAETT